LISTKISLIRNIHGYPFACSKNNKNSEVVDQVSRAVEKMKIKGINAKPVEINSEEFQKLDSNYNINFTHSTELKDLGIQEDFPTNRLVFHFEKDNIFAVVNDLDHLKLKIYISDEKLQAQFIKLLKISNEFSKSLNLIYDKHLGFLTACPDLLGSGMVTKSKIKLKNLILKEELLQQLTTKYDFSYNILDKDEAFIEVQNKFTVGRSEIDILSNLICLINILIEEDNISIE
jgi:protein-arginine kinase